MRTAAECPFDIATTVLMDPVRGPSIPTTEDEMYRAFLLQLGEIRQEYTHKQKLTEADRCVGVHLSFPAPLNVNLKSSYSYQHLQYFDFPLKLFLRIV